MIISVPCMLLKILQEEYGVGSRCSSEKCQAQVGLLLGMNFLLLIVFHDVVLVQVLNSWCS